MKMREVKKLICLLVAFLPLTFFVVKGNMPEIPPEHRVVKPITCGPANGDVVSFGSTCTKGPGACIQNPCPD